MNYELFKPLLFKLEPEKAHCLLEYTLRAINCISPALLSFFAKNSIIDNESLRQEFFNLHFYNPVGLAGGYDKNGTMIRPLSAFGFGFLEYGTFTLKPQKGNEKPRLFRLTEQESLQNAMGFNNLGKDIIASNISKIYPFILPLGANIAKNKDTDNEKALEEYLNLLSAFENLCDYFVINISSPNTKNLRALQDEAFVTNLLQKARELTLKPIFIKIAPDMDINAAFKLCESAIKHLANGFIIANTSTDYTLIENGRNFGGLSGKLIAQKNNAFLKALASAIYASGLEKELVLIASGGIDDAYSAYERIKNGANLIQIYSALVFKGIKVVKDINEGLLELLKQDGFLHISEAVGVNLK